MQSGWALSWKGGIASADLTNVLFGFHLLYVCAEYWLVGSDEHELVHATDNLSCSWHGMLASFSSHKPRQISLSKAWISIMDGGLWYCYHFGRFEKWQVVGVLFDAVLVAAEPMSSQHLLSLTSRGRRRIDRVESAATFSQTCPSPFLVSCSRPVRCGFGHNCTLQNRTKDVFSPL